MAEPAKRELIETIKKIPIFQGLSPTQIRKILEISTAKSFKPEEKLCRAGSPSEELFILIAGELAVVTGNGERIASIVPVTTVGEMGMITRQPRSATVEAVKPSRVLILKRAQFDVLLRGESNMKARTYENIIGILSDKLIRDNIRIREHDSETVLYEDRISDLKRRLRAALDLLEERGAVREEAESHVAEKAQEIPGRILVVDDNPEARQLMKNILRLFEVEEAGDGREALELVASKEFDLVVTDIRMPGMDGYAMFERLQRDYPDLPVVAISGVEEGREVAQYDFAGFFEKPVRIDVFRALVDELVER